MNKRLIVIGGGKKKFRDTFERADGAIGAPWTGATWTISSNAAVNTPTAGGEDLSNGNMETGDPPTGWPSYSGANLQVDGVADERTGGAGAQSLDILNLAVVYGYAKQALDNGSGIWMALGGYGKRINSNPALILTTSGGTSLGSKVLDTSGSWTYGYFVARTSGAACVFRCAQQANTNGANCRFDDVTAIPLTLSTLLCTTPINYFNAAVSVGITFDAGSGVQAGLILNLDSTSSPANFILVYCNRVDNKIYVDECVAGTYTNKAATAYTYAAGAALLARKSSPTTVSVTYNSAAVGTAITVTSNTNKLFGMFSTGSATQAQFDNFSLVPA